MARKKEEFDPLAGPIGGGGSRKKKSKGKSFDVLGGGVGREHTVEKESFNDYSGVSFQDSSDALMETGGSSSKSKPKKKGFFASLFGGGRKKKQSAKERESRPLEAEERPQSYVPKNLRDPELTIHDGLVETGIVGRVTEPEQEKQQIRYDEPHEEEEDLFEEADAKARSVRDPPPRETSERAPVKTAAPLPSSRVAQTPAASPHTCCLCGAASPAALPTFGSADPVPLCRTCYRAVTTLMKFRDPSDEREIKTEWYTLCPNLDSDRADSVIERGRRNS